MADRKRLPLKLNLRDWSLRGLVKDPAHVRGLDSSEGGIADHKAAGIHEIKSTGRADDRVPGYSGHVPDENPDPLKQRVWPGGPKKTITKIMAALSTRLGPPTPAQQKIIDEKKRRKAMQQLLRYEARLYMKRIVNALERRNLCYRYRKGEKDLFISGVKNVSFDRVGLQPDAVYFRVDTMNLPRGVGILDLVEETVLTDLSLATTRRVTAEWSEKIGLWYIVERATGVRGIPNQVSFDDLLIQMPQTADALTIPLGLTVNSKPVYRSLETMPHLLIAGATGTGKSNMMNVIIGSLIQKNAPAQLRFLMIDLKGGMEMTFYEGLPHLISIPGLTENGIVYEREQVPDVLGWLIKQSERRMEILKQHGAKNIRQYNAHRKHNRMYRIVLVIDEWADVRLVQSIGRVAEDRLTNIASRGRAVGIHVILATQSPKKEVISTLVKTNLPGKMAFSMPSYTSSQLILDNGDAKGLEPVGRYVYQQGAEQTTIQAPYMSNQAITKIVEEAKGGKVAAAGSDDLTNELIEYAYHNLDGRLAVRDLHSAFKGRIGYQSLSGLVRQLDGQVFSVGGREMIVDPGNGGSIGRHLQPNNGGVNGKNGVTHNTSHLPDMGVLPLSKDWRPAKTKKLAGEKQ